MAVDAADIGTENRNMRLVQVALIGVVFLFFVLAIGVPLGGRIKADRAASAGAESLHISGRALLIYAQDWGGIESGMPSAVAAATLLSGKSTCDPDDTWRHGCTGPTVAPMIGSLAYVRGTKYFTILKNWRADLAANPNPTLLIDPFRSERHIDFFAGDEPKGGLRYEALPLDMLRFRADGSLSSKVTTPNTAWYPFKWPTAFWVGENTRSIPPELNMWASPAPTVASAVRARPKAKHP